MPSRSSASHHTPIISTQALLRSSVLFSHVKGIHPPEHIHLSHFHLSVMICPRDPCLTLIHILKHTMYITRNSTPNVPHTQQSPCYHCIHPSLHDQHVVQIAPTARLIISTDSLTDIHPGRESGRFRESLRAPVSPPSFAVICERRYIDISQTF